MQERHARHGNELLATTAISSPVGREKKPRRRAAAIAGGVSSESSGNWWHKRRAKINFDVQIPRGVRLNALTTNGHVEVSTSEWASARTTNGSVRVSIGDAKWSGELELETNNGGIRTDFPITVQGRFGPKSLSGTVGGGGRELKVATTNGGIELRKS